MSAEEFVRRLRARPRGTEYALLLGAGCSVSSGIPAAGSLVHDHWLPRLQKLRGKDGDLDVWAAKAVSGYDASAPALSYGPVMDTVFPTPHERRSEVERICRGRDPGFGCCVLAKLIESQNPDFNVILTTNFDDLIADALYLFTAVRPLVISHAALARFMLAEPGKPLIAKLHGDYQLEPLNTEDEVAALNTLVGERLKRLLQQRGLIVIGYGGNDESVMSALEDLPEDALAPGVWWVSRTAPSDRVAAWLASRAGGHWVESPDFDQLMLLVQREFELPHPGVDRWEGVCAEYFEALSQLGSAVEKLDPTEPSAPAVKRASAEARDRVQGWWGVELAARRFKSSEPAKADEIYREGLEKYPQSPELLGNYAIFLTRDLRDQQRAQEIYERALRAGPELATNLGNYANFLTDVRKDHDRAEELYKQALELEPNDADHLGNYANFLTDVREDHDRAEQMYERALQVQPDHANNLGNLARFYRMARNDDERAAELFERALQLEPDHANNLGSYANLLTTVRGEYAQAEDLFARALARAPDHPNLPNLLGNYARHSIWRGRVQEGVKAAERALPLAENPQLCTELWFYIYANGPEDRRSESLSKLKDLLRQGVRSPKWDVSGNVRRAEEAGHPEARWLPRLADVLADDAALETLDQWEAWAQA